MCVASMIGDHYRDKFTTPYWPERIDVPAPVVSPGVVVLPPEITRAEFDQLRRDVEEMKTLLKRAKEYDERNHEPACEVEEKMELLRKVAKLVGVSLDDVIAPAV